MFTHARFVFSLSLLARSQAGAFHKLLSNFLTTFSISSNVFAFWAFFSSFRLILKYLSRLLVLKIDLVSILHNALEDNLWISCEKGARSSLRSPGGADHGRKVHAAGLLGQRFFFLKKIWNGERRFPLDWHKCLRCGAEGRSDNNLIGSY